MNEYQAETIFLVWKSDKDCSTTKRELVAVCNGKHLLALIKKLKDCEEITKEQLENFMNIVICEEASNNPFCWWIEAGDSDTSFYIARYPSNTATVDFGGII